MFRGADYRNVLRFREDFPDAKVVLLEQNYRSTQTILDIANAVISKQPPSHAETAAHGPRAGPHGSMHEAYDEADEAQFVVNTVHRLVADRRGGPGRL
jgi:DNA helicase II / ATP-dependent DNA helicase PcrA